MTKKKDQSDPFGWVDEITKPEQPQTVEPFEPNSTSKLVDYNGYYCVADRSVGTQRKPYPARIDVDIVEMLDKCHGSTNAVINALLRYAINDLKAKKKTLIS